MPVIYIFIYLFFSQQLCILHPNLLDYYFPWCLRVYLAHHGKLRATDVKPVDPQRKYGSQSHHAAHSRHVVQVRLWVLNVPGTYGEYSQEIFIHVKNNDTVSVFRVRLPEHALFNDSGTSLFMQVRQKSIGKTFSYKVKALISHMKKACRAVTACECLLLQSDSSECSFHIYSFDRRFHPIRHNE